MRLESHWRILKKDYTSHLVRPRLDSLCYILCTGVVKSRLHLYFQVDGGRKKPSLVISQRDLVYHADRVLGVCSCPSFIFNSRYMCKHLLSFYSSPHPDRNGKYIVRSPPAFGRELFQERLPLILFSGSDTGMTSSSGKGSVHSSPELINSVVDGPGVTSSSYVEELASFELMHRKTLRSLKAMTHHRGSCVRL
ncbi:hypothetical protein V1506DRAFT_65982 [Lipomyces tetrasporus]